jgi:PAS domain S-box-containing protein
MKLFWKIYTTTFISFIIVVSFAAYALSIRRISDTEKHIIEENGIFGSFLSKQIEVGYLKSKWPFESLSKLSEYRSFLFWWVVRDDGTIHLADDASFMGTYAYEYFPQAANMTDLGSPSARTGTGEDLGSPSAGNSEDESVFLNRKQNYGICIKSLETGKEKYVFWLGFSLKEISRVRKGIISSAIAGSMSVMVILGVILYFAIKRFTKPIDDLTTGAAIIGKGDLTHRVRMESQDELSQLANSFNKMAADLQETTVSKDYVNNIIGSMVDSLIVVDPDAKIRTVNKATCELLGYKKEELIGSPVEHIFAAAKEIPLKGKELEKLIEEGELRNYETHYKAKNGQEIPILFSGSVMKDKYGNVIWIVCMGRDIAERKRAEEALQHRLEVEERITGELEEKTEELSQSNEELNAFVYNVSHDLKAPVVSLQGFSSLLMKDYEDRLDEDGKMYIERIQKNSERMALLIDNLLELSRIGRMKGQEELVNISDIISDVVDGLAPQLEEKGTRLTVKDGMPTVRCDRTRMEQIFANLISNANKFMGEDNQDPTIEVGCDDKDSCHTFYVRDNGIGIDEEYHDKIFQIFQRLDDIETEGTGVGLAIVKKIVESFGGRIWVDSAKGKGTTVYFIMNS